MGATRVAVNDPNQAVVRPGRISDIGPVHESESDSKPLSIILSTLLLLANDLPKYVRCDFANFAQILRLLGELYENG